MRKTLLISALIISLLFSIGASAQYGSSTTDNTKAQTNKPPLKSLKGTVQTEGDKITFVTDKDQKSWAVMNPEKLKGHEGHHVKVKAHVYTDKGAIHIMSVTMLKGKKTQ